MSEEVWQILRKRGAIRILLELRDRGKARGTDLWRWTKLDYGVAYRRLSELAEFGLIERRSGFENGRRCVFYTLTKKGKELTQKLKVMTIEEFVKTLRLS